MEDRLKKIESNLARLQQSSKRDFEHVFRVMAAQRERFEQSLDAIKTELRFFLLDQEIALRGELLHSRTEMSALREDLIDLIQAVGDHDQRLERLEDTPPAA
jgi:hypothetical protein